MATSLPFFTSPSVSSPSGSLVFTETTKKRVNCACMNPKCKELTKLFKSINDVRGGFFTMPGDCDRYGDVKSFRLARTADHLDLDITDLISRDDRNRSTTAPASPANTRGPKKTKRTYKYVARHHYHPQILQQFVVHDGFKNIDYIDAFSTSNNVEET